MKYKVRVSELRYGEVEVDAESEEAAKTIATGSEIDFFDSEITDMTAEPVAEDRTYIVTEVCQNCGNEIEMRWNTDALGYQAVCPVCGHRLMLCDECRHTDEQQICDYCSETDSCRRSRERKLWMRLGVSFAVFPEEERAILGGGEDLAVRTLHRIIREGRFAPDGDSYIPETVVADFNKRHGTHYKETDIGFDA